MRPPPFGLYIVAKRKNQIQGRPKTMPWLKLTRNSFTCFTLGLPPSLHLNDIERPYPNSDSFLWALFQISEVIQQIHKMYRNGNMSINSDLKTAYQILRKLQCLSSSLEKNSGISIGTSLDGDQCERLVQGAAISYCKRTVALLHSYTDDGQISSIQCV
jgi:hypothetical protein